MRIGLQKHPVALALLTFALACWPAAASADNGRIELVGSLHEHSGYSDGWPGSTPRDYFAAGSGEGLDFMGSSDHSDNVDLPLVLSAYCLKNFLACLEADRLSPSDSYRKWQATLEQADSATTPTFTAIRGFEWTSDVWGHINVYFSRNVSNAKEDGGTPEFLWRWLSTPSSNGGGLDGIATFNHPGAKGTVGAPEFNWHDFAYRRAIDRQMVGIETFNDQTDYGSIPSKGSPPSEGWYAHALDRGWHLGAIGAEDLGHNLEDNWGGGNRAKTVIVSTGRGRSAIKAAMLERRFYAIKRAGIRLEYTLDGRPMGSRFDASAGANLHVEARVTAPAEGTGLHIEVITSGGRIAATADDSLSTDVPATSGERWYYVRVRRGSEPIAYSSPVWTTTALMPDSDPPFALSPRARANALAISGYDSARADATGQLTVPIRCIGISPIPCVAGVTLTAVIAGRVVTVGRIGPQVVQAGFGARPRVQLSGAALAAIKSGGSLQLTVTAGKASKSLRALGFS